MAGDQHKKRRTRAHVIADISANYVEHFALAAGFSVERIQKDYGYDLSIATYTTAGFIENGSVLLQLKATDAGAIAAKDLHWSLRVRTADLRLWLREPYPVILVYYHGRLRGARWLYVQRDLKHIQVRPGQARSRYVYLDPTSLMHNHLVDFRDSRDVYWSKQRR